MLVKSLSNFSTVPNRVGNSWECLSCETSGASCLSLCCKCHKHLHGSSCGISTPLLPRSAGIQRQRDAHKHKPLRRMETNRRVPCTGCFIYCLICIFARIPVCNLDLNAKWQYHCINFTLSTFSLPETQAWQFVGHSLGPPAQWQSQRLGKREKSYSTGKADFSPSPAFPWLLRRPVVLWVTTDGIRLVPSTGKGEAIPPGFQPRERKGPMQPDERPVKGKVSNLSA